MWKLENKRFEKVQGNLTQCYNMYSLVINEFIKGDLKNGNYFMDFDYSFVSYSYRKEEGELL